MKRLAEWQAPGAVWRVGYGGPWAAEIMTTVNFMV
jgi:hypothetical protein